MMPAPQAAASRRSAALALALALAIALIVLAAFPETSLAQNAARPGRAAATAKAVGWGRGVLMFLVSALACAYIWYQGVFPWLLRKGEPSWPLDAWRWATAGAWTTTCLSAILLDRPTPLMTRHVFGPLLNQSSLSTLFFIPIVLPVILCLGLLVIWNFRRDEAASRPV